MFIDCNNITQTVKLGSIALQVLGPNLRNPCKIQFDHRPVREIHGMQLGDGDYVQATAKKRTKPVKFLGDMDQVPTCQPDRTPVSLGRQQRRPSAQQAGATEPLLLRSSCRGSTLCSTGIRSGTQRWRMP